LSGRGLCDELITRPEESYRLWCVVVCDLETSRIGAPYIYDISNLRVKPTVLARQQLLSKSALCYVTRQLPIFFKNRIDKQTPRGIITRGTLCPGHN